MNALTSSEFGAEKVTAFISPAKTATLAEKELIIHSDAELFDPGSPTSIGNVVRIGRPGIGQPVKVSRTCGRPRELNEQHTPAIIHHRSAWSKASPRQHRLQLSPWSVRALGACLKSA
jgi:hypothetical protein